MANEVGSGTFDEFLVVRLLVTLRKNCRSSISVQTGCVSTLTGYSQMNVDMQSLYQNTPAPAAKTTVNPIAGMMEMAGKWMGSWFRSMDKNSTAKGNQNNPFASMMNG